MNNAAATKAVTPNAAANLAGPADFRMANNRSKKHAPKEAKETSKPSGLLGHFCLLGRFFPVLCKRQVNFNAQSQHLLLAQWSKSLKAFHFFAATLESAAANASRIC